MGNTMTLSEQELTSVLRKCNVRHHILHEEDITSINISGLDDINAGKFHPDLDLRSTNLLNEVFILNITTISDHSSTCLSADCDFIE